MSRSRLVLSAAVVACLVLLAAPRVLAAGDENAFTVTCDTSLEKLFPIETEHAASMPAAASISLAANETEAFQVVVSAKSDLKGVRVTPGSVTSAGTGEAARGLSVDVRAVGYVPVIKPFYTPYYIRVPGQAKWPDPLLPQDSADIAAGTIQPYWVSVHAAAGTPAGDYNGTMTVSSAGEKSSVTFTVHVWDFTLPSESHLKTAFWVYGRYIMQYHKIASKEEPAYGEMLAKYNSDLLAHRMSPFEVSINIPSPHPVIEEGKPTDWSEWDAWMEGWIAKGQNFFVVPITSDEPKETMILKARAWGAHLKEKGWLDKCCVFLVDESTKGEDMRAWIHQGDGDLPNALTWHPTPDCPNVDIWIPQMERGYEKYPESIRWARHEGLRLWMYTSSPASGGKGTDFYPNTNIDFPASHCRLLPWVCWQDNLEGYLYWAVTNWEKSPWETAETFRNQNGNGSWFYPGKDGPVDSLRAEEFRDGMEDYEYFYMLNDLVKSARADESKIALCTEALKLLDLWGASPRDFMYKVNRDPSDIYEIRAHAAQLIERLSPRPR